MVLIKIHHGHSSAWVKCFLYFGVRPTPSIGSNCRCSLVYKIDIVEATIYGYWAQGYFLHMEPHGNSISSWCKCLYYAREDTSGSSSCIQPMWLPDYWLPMCLSNLQAQRSGCCQHCTQISGYPFHWCHKTSHYDSSSSIIDYHWTQVKPFNLLPTMLNVGSNFWWSSKNPGNDNSSWWIKGAGMLSMGSTFKSHSWSLLSTW